MNQLHHLHRLHDGGTETTLIYLKKFEVFEKFWFCKDSGELCKTGKSTGENLLPVKLQ
jgi:hypothetical protein